MKKIMIILTLCIMAVSGFAGVSESQFNQIQPGMSFREVQSIINEWGYSVQPNPDQKLYLYFFKNQGEGFSIIIYQNDQVIQKKHTSPSWSSGQKEHNILNTFHIGRLILKDFPDLEDFSLRLMGLILSLQTPEKIYSFLYLYGRQYDKRFAPTDERNRKFISEFISDLKEFTKTEPSVSLERINEWMQEYSDQDQRKLLITTAFLAHFGLFNDQVQNHLHGLYSEKVPLLTWLKAHILASQTLFIGLTSSMR